MTANIRKSFTMSEDHEILLNQHAALPRYEGKEARVIRQALIEFFKAHAKDLTTGSGRR